MRELCWDRLGRRNRPGHATFRRALDLWHRPDSKTQFAGVHVSLPKAQADLVGQQGQLVGPDAARDSQEEYTSEEREGKCPLRDAGADGVAPGLGRDGRSKPGEAVLSRARENRVNRFRTARAVPQADHRPMT